MRQPVEAHRVPSDTETALLYNAYVSGNYELHVTF